MLRVENRAACTGSVHTDPDDSQCVERDNLKDSRCKMEHTSVVGPPLADRPGSAPHCLRPQPPQRDHPPHAVASAAERLARLHARSASA